MATGYTWYGDIQQYAGNVLCFDMVCKLMRYLFGAGLLVPKSYHSIF
jgi:hypothetical protein